MRKILPILLGVTVYLAPLYPVYAQNTPPREASGPALVRDVRTLESVGERIGEVDKVIRVDGDNIASRAAMFREKLLKFKDKVRAGRVEKINNNLDIVNQRRTSAMAQNLTRLSQILEKLKDKATEAETAGKDVAELNNAIAEVESAWAEADQAVKAQMEKDYSIILNTEATVQEDAKTTRDTLHTDLRTVHLQIVGVKQAMGDAIQAALNSLGGNNAAE